MALLLCFCVLRINTLFTCKSYLLGRPFENTEGNGVSVHTYSIFSLLHHVSSQGSLGNYGHYFSFYFFAFAFFLPSNFHVRKIFKDKPLQDKNFIILFLPLSFLMCCAMVFSILFTVFQESQEEEERNKKLMGKQDPHDKCFFFFFYLVFPRTLGDLF